MQTVKLRKLIYLLTFLFLFMICSSSIADDGTIGDYRVSYETEGDALVIINTRDVATVNVTAEKIWDDEINQDGIRPENVYFQLYADGEPQGEPVELTEESNPNKWSYTWEGLDKNKNGQAVNYSVQETSTPSGYSANLSEDGLTVTNKHDPEMMDMVISWNWDDDFDRDGVRQDAVDIDVFAGGSNVGTVTFGDSNTGTAAIRVPVYTPRRQGVPAQYTFSSQNLSEDYSMGADDSGRAAAPVLTAVHDPERVYVKVDAVWDDSDNQDGKRPENVIWQLKKDGTEEGDPVTLASDATPHEWTSLYRYHDGGVEYNYTVEDTTLPVEYTPQVSLEKDGGNFIYNITNSYATETVDIPLTITWDDDDDQDGVRPEMVTVRVIANGEPTDVTVVIEGNNGWSAVAEGLPRYKDGEEIEYTFEAEFENDNYKSKSDPDDSGNLILTHKSEIREFAAVIHWDDMDNQDGLRPGAVSVQLYADDEPVGDPKVVVSALAANSRASLRMMRPARALDIYSIGENEDWKTEWTELNRYKDGEEIVYTARLTDNLEPDYSESHEDFENCTVITLVHRPDKRNVEFVVEWEDENNQDGTRPGSIDISLYNGDEKLDTQNIPAAENVNEGVFENVDANQNGHVIEYTLKPITLPEGYTLEVETDGDGVIHLKLGREPKSLVRKAVTIEDGQNLDREFCRKWGIVTIHLYVHNYGQNTLYNVTFRDYLPEPAYFHEDARSLSGFDEEAGDSIGIGEDANGKFLNVNIGQLKPGDAREITYLASAENPAVFGNVPAYFDYGNEEPLPLSAPRPEYESNSVTPCKWDGQDGGDEEETSSVTKQPTELPKTGFAPNVVTKLPEMSVNYQAYSQLRIRIPKIGVDAEILGVPYENGDWDVTWLGGNVGWLQNTAYPGTTGKGNSVLTGHLTNNYGLPGVFAELEKLSYGDEIIITAFGETYTYVVDNTMTVYYDTPQILSQNTDLPVLTLITCKYFNSSTGLYEGRFVVTAKLSQVR
ncbi:MAG: sortase [Anaerolineaceae bacterium]|nr:sortase [Anaerolineaceae bacterium]